MVRIDVLRRICVDPTGYMLTGSGSDTCAIMSEHQRLQAIDAHRAESEHFAADIGLNYSLIIILKLYTLYDPTHNYWTIPIKQRTDEPIRHQA